MRLSAPVLLLFSLSAPACAELLVHGADIVTMNPRQPRASALLIDGGGRIAAVGDQDLLQVHPDAERVDLGGRAVVPGLIDAHAHLANLALKQLQADLVGAASKEETLARLVEFERTLGPDDWLLGRGWDQNDWPIKEFPNRQDLDEHFPDRPVWLRRIDGHAAWANSAALRAVDRDLVGDWQVDGGMIHRDAAGRPTGIFIDRAMALVQGVVPATSPEAFDRGLDRALGQLSAAGLTGIHDAGLDLDTARHYQRRIEAGRFPLRVHGMADGMKATLDTICDAPIRHPSGRFQLRAVKLYADGALGSRGAALVADYSDEPGNRGLLFEDQQTFVKQLDRVLGCGLQAAVHAIGDRANHVVLNAYEAVLPRHPDNPGRHRIEHVQVLLPSDIPRFATLGIVASMQPTHQSSDMYWAVDRLGPERARHAYAWRALADSGALLALGSDFPVESVNPMLGLSAAVTRRDIEGHPPGGWYPEQALTVEEALRGFTLDAARAAFMEDEVGSLEPGKRADFVVLDRDPLTAPAADLHRIEVLETWLDGERVYPADDNGL